jgi:hypothetical protein
MADTESLDDLSLRFMIWLHGVSGGDTAKSAVGLRFLDTVPDIELSRATLTAMVNRLEARRLVRTRGSLASSIQEVRITWDGIVAVSNATDRRKWAV